MQVARFEVGDKVILINDTPIAPEGHIDVISRIVQGLQPQPLITLEGLPESFVYEHEIALLSHVEQKVEEQKADGKQASPIKSDGGSSSYYDIELPQWLVDLVVKRSESSKIFIKTEELIEVMFNSDFDFANSFKSLVRAYGTMNGAGKEGNTVEYEMNKNIYSSNRIKERAKR